MRKILLPILIFLSFLAVAILPSSLSVCAPGECAPSGGACGGNLCVAENLIDHLDARARLLDAILNFKELIAFAAVVIALFKIKKHSENKKVIAAKSYAKQNFFNFPGVKLSDCFTKLFSRGVLHPRIY